MDRCGRDASQGSGARSLRVYRWYRTTLCDAMRWVGTVRQVGGTSDKGAELMDSNSARRPAGASRLQVRLIAWSSTEQAITWNYAEALGGFNG
jgi:hypothetical protein